MRRSSRARVVAVVALALIALAACKKERELPPGLGPRGPVVDVDTLQAPALFAHIPADAPYVLASFEAVSLDYYAKIKRATAPALARSVDELRALGADTDLGRWLDAVTDELAGKWTASGLESLGLSARPRFAIYGHGALPVVARLEIKDGKALLATIERIAHRAGEALPPLENRHGREFWRIELPDDTGAIVAIADDQLVAAFGPRHAIAAALPQILGAEQPARSMADGAELKQVIARHRLGPVMVGFADTKRLAHALIALAERTPPADCLAGIDRLAARVPRLAFGYSELTDKRFSGAAVLELAPPLVEELKALRAAVPGLGAALAGEPLFAMGGGLDLERGKAAGQAAAAVLRDLGRACEAEDLVDAARELREGLAEGLPGPLAAVAGGAISIDSIDLGSDHASRRRYSSTPIPRGVEGFAMLAVADAKDAFRSIAAFLPPVSEIEPDGRLHELPLTKFGMPFDIHAGVGERAMVVAAGSRGKRLAREVLEATGGGKAPFLAGTLDLRKTMELGAQLDGASSTRDLDESMAAMFGRATFSLDVTEAGLALWMSGELP
ncbi:MAG TPA: hypothetical protein VK932_03040 [Kofleriaceae bacterium]|nr:hypothetical protein [Kofleriaceae bacterium]